MADIDVRVSDFPIQVAVTAGNVGGGISASYVTGVSGVLQKQITDSGSYLLSQIQVSNAGVSSLNHLTGQINLTGLGSNTITINGQTIQISGAAIPVNVSGYITTGNADLRYYAITNPQSYIKSGEVIGVYYPLTNPAGYITGFNSGLYTLNSQTGNFTGIFLTRAETGQFNTGNLIGYATVNNLFSTGSNLQNQIFTLQNGSYVTGISINGSSQRLTGYVTFAAANGDVSLGQNSTSIIISVPGLTSTGAALYSLLTGQSGNSNTTFATIVNLQTTGQTLYNLLTGESGQLSNNLGATGSFLYGLINASSAGVSSLNSHSGAISLTGAGAVSVIVNGQNFTISGDTGNLIGYATTNNLLLTGQQAWTTANNNGINLSGNLQSTGSTLDSKINSLSGYSNNVFATQISLNTTNTNLTSTGVTLGAKIDSLSGYSNTTFSTIVNLQNTGQANYNLTTGLSGKLDITGSTLDTKINSLSGYSNNTFATVINLVSTGQQLWIIGQNNGNNISGNLQSTGQNLYNLLVNASGALNSSGALDARLQSTGSFLFGLINASSAGVSSINSKSGVISMTGAGNVSVISTTQNFIISGNTGDLIGYATIANLQTTGQIAYNLITALSGKLDATGTNLQNQINSINSKSLVTGISITGGTGITGLFNLTGDNTVNYSVSGQQLTQSVNTNVIATVSNLQSTGQQSYNLIVNLSGRLDATGTSLQNQINTLTSNLTQTGVTIEAQINSLSGYSNATFATIINLQTTGQNAWNTANNNSINLSGNLQATGSYLLGLIGGSTAGVSSINSRTGITFITGIGSVVVTTTGQIITISGITPITGGTIVYDFGLVNLITGSQNSQFIQFHQNFSTIPNVYGNLINNSGDGIIASIISGTSVSGFYINLSEILNTNNYYFDYLATTGIGFYNFALSAINTVIGSSIGNITGSGISNYIPQFTSDGIGITNSVISGQNTGIYISGMLTVTDKIIVPNANFRVKDGQMQFWDSGAWAVDSTKPWRALGVFSGATIWSVPILD